MKVLSPKVETKVVLLLSPHELSNYFRILESLHITKSASSINFNSFELDSKELRLNYSNLQKEAKDICFQFSKDPIYDAQLEIKQLLNKQRPGISPEVFIRNAMLRHLQRLFESLKPFTQLCKWYHRTPTDKVKVFKTTPCIFSTYRPQLSFDVTKNNNGSLKLSTSIVLNGDTYSLNTFTRHHFLLESNSEYFILTYKDYQTLEWLALEVEKYANNPAEFSQNILSRLETDYPVNRNNLFSEKEVVAPPVNRVMLNELNNSFLMMTPQWVYDGFIVEGACKDKHEVVANGEEFEIKRDKEAEESFLKLLTSLHPNFSNQRNGYFYLSFSDAQKKQWFLKAYHQLLDLEIELTGMDMLQHFRYSQHKIETTVKVKKEIGSRVLLNMTVSFGSEKIAPIDLQKMVLAGQKAVLLKDGSLGILNEDWLQQYSAILKHGKINKDEVEVARFMAVSEQNTSEQHEVLKSIIKEQWWQKWRQWQNGETNIYAVPETVKATLRPYQQRGFEWLTLLNEAGAGACLADDMGLGKTLQTICFLARYIVTNPKATNIIVCPSSLIYNWQQELQKFAPTITTLVHHGASRNVKELDAGHNVIITSYGTIRVDSELLLQKDYGVAIIDESHNIKNPTARITSIVGMLKADARIALSGTPVVNNTFDLYAQLNFALPGMFGSREFFKREYADAIDRDHDEEKIKTLQKLTAPFILRRTKEQVAKDLPEKTEMVLWCNMSTEQKNLYNEIKEQVRGNLFVDIKNHGLNKSKLAVLQGMMKLRQICNSPLLLPIDEQQGCSESIKTKVLLQELSHLLSQHKVLVFSQFTSMLNLLSKECDNLGMKYYHFDGQTPPTKRAEMVSAFQNKDDNTNLFLISLKAGNSGLTLTAADYVFLFDPWWNTAVEQQAIDRTHRIGQTKNVFAYKIICRDTIEEKIIQLQQRKKKLAEELVAEDDSFIRSLSEEDIEYLFS